MISVSNNCYLLTQNKGFIIIIIIIYFFKFKLIIVSKTICNVVFILNFKRIKQTDKKCNYKIFLMDNCFAGTWVQHSPLNALAAASDYHFHSHLGRSLKNVDDYGGRRFFVIGVFDSYYLMKDRVTINCSAGVFIASGGSDCKPLFIELSGYILLLFGSSMLRSITKLLSCNRFFSW